MLKEWFKKINSHQQKKKKKMLLIKMVNNIVNIEYLSLREVSHVLVSYLSEEIQVTS